MGMGGQRHALATLPQERPSTHCTGGPLGQSVRVRKILPLPGFDPQTVQPVTSCYTNYNIPAYTKS